MVGAREIVKEQQVTTAEEVLSEFVSNLLGQDLPTRLRSTRPSNRAPKLWRTKK